MSFISPVSAAHPLSHDVQMPAGNTLNPSAGDSSNFMNLLVTQLQHQNPMEPMESGDLLNQLTAMTSVSELKGIRAGIQTLQHHFFTSKMADMSSLIGKQLSQDASSFNIEGNSKPLKMTYASPGSQQSLTLRLFGNNNELVAEKNITTKADERQGETISQPLNSIFGALAPGQYSIEAITADEKLHPTFITSTIQGISYQPGTEPQLMVESTSSLPLTLARQITL